MAYKSILVHVDSGPHAQHRVEFAAKLAQAHDAHLTGLFVAPMAQLNAPMAPSPIYDVGASLLNYLKDSAQRACQTFTAVIERLGVDKFEWREDLTDPALAMQVNARYHDLVVMGQTDPDTPVDALTGDFPQSVVFASARPVLMVPYAGEFSTIGRNVLIAWNASPEATRAVTDALPLLRRAEHVTLLTLNARIGPEGHGEAPGSDIALFLARHGIQAEIRNENAENIVGSGLAVALAANFGTLTQRSVDVGNLILSRAADMGSDLIIMGCYGHSRLRELILGGVSHTIFSSMTVPVLMSH